MFTIQQIQQAHSKVKSGADFPVYIHDIYQLGVRHYTTFLHDGHTEFTGLDNHNITSESKYPGISIAAEANPATFRQHLQDHQQGRSDYLSFCHQAAASGVEKWIVDLEKRTAIYFNQHGEPMLTERIPG